MADPDAAVHVASAGPLARVGLRAYRRDDLEAMFRLDEICFEGPFRFSKRAMRRFAEARNAQVLVAASGEDLAAFSIVHVERFEGARVGYVVTLDIAPGYRRQGLARVLMDHAERDARAAGCEAMVLHVFAENGGAIALYEKLGYSRLRLTEGFYSPGRHAWVYRKELVAGRRAGG